MFKRRGRKSLLTPTPMADSHDSSSDAAHAEDWRALHVAVRAHELELNRATAAFEHAVIAPLTLLNGGAAAAWLTFLGGGSEVEASAIYPALAWAVGLVLAVGAAALGWRRQRAFSQAERWRRESLEMLWLGSCDADLRNSLAVLTSFSFREAWGDSLKSDVKNVGKANRGLPGWGGLQVEEARALAISKGGEWLGPRLLTDVSLRGAKVWSGAFLFFIIGAVISFLVGGVLAGSAV